MTGVQTCALPISILNIRQRTYLIPKTFDPTVLSTRCVLIYLIDPNKPNPDQLIRDRDFVFNTETSSISFKSHVVLDYNMSIRVVDYSNTVENYIPETPTKLGLYPKFTPRIYVDDTYRNPITVIQGHDGSITPAFGDHRDQMLLELELRIYNNLKVEYYDSLLESYETIPGRFRTSDYSRQEFQQLITRTFLNWIGSNKINYSLNSFFNPNDSWTWTYNKFIDKFGDLLPGHWRGIYKYYYDTDRPHICPWEMLGFTEKPDYWDSTYGVAPYTSGNKVMWEHLELGYVVAGQRAGVDSKFARPGLSKIIPVDEYGQIGRAHV